MDIDFEGKEYHLREGIWFCGYKKAPQFIQDQLNSQAEEDLHLREEALIGVPEILQASKLAEKRNDLLRALALARKAYEVTDFKVSVAARVGHLYRKLGEPEEAIKWTEAFARTTYVPLLNTRAAAFADIGEYLQAKKVAGKSLSIRPGNAEAFELLNRVQSEYPGAYYDLF
jgi:tetratricopeptide (TPR) repeat protein